MAVESVPEIGFGRCIISATTPVSPGEAGLRRDAPPVARRRVLDHEADYGRCRSAMVLKIDRKNVKDRARRELGGNRDTISSASSTVCEPAKRENSARLDSRAKGIPIGVRFGA